GGVRLAAAAGHGGGPRPRLAVARRQRYDGDSMSFGRITVEPDKMGGVPCIRGLRVPVAAVVDMVAEGMSPEEILDFYPDLVREDISEALHFAAEAVRERQIPYTLAP